MEDYEDVIAYSCEGEFCGDKLGTEKLSAISILFIIDEIGPQRIKVSFSNGVRLIEIGEDTDIVELLAEIEGLYVVRETVDSGPVSWTTDVILAEDLSKAIAISSDIDALWDALNRLQANAEREAK